MAQTSLQPIITLYDAITDSPVFRSSVCHYDQQLDHLEHWLDGLSRQLKLYIEKLNKLDADTAALCEKAIPQGIDETLIDPNFTGAVIKSFAEALQTSLSFKSKLISHLEQSLVSPLQQFVKTHLRDFKNFRKQYVKATEKYENQLAKYSSLSKTKEPSSIREEAFRLFEARKEYVRMSGQHVLKILNLRSLLEHCLVENFSADTVAHKDFYKDIQVWANLDAAMSYWKQWLMDDKFTRSYQLHQQELARKKLEDEFIRLTEPGRSLDTYVTPVPTENPETTLNNSKWGYLNVRVSKHSWVRKWFFIHDGFFGSCQLDTNSKQGSTIVTENRIAIAEYKVIDSLTDTDRRFCFEITLTNHSNAAFVLQTETEESLQDWIRTFKNNKEMVAESSSSGTHSKTPSMLLKAKSKPTTFVSSPIVSVVTENHSTTSSPKIKQTDSLSSSSFSSISDISSSTTTNNNKIRSAKSNNTTSGGPFSASALSLLSKEKDTILQTEGEGPSIVTVSTTPDSFISLANSPSLTPLLVWESTQVSKNPRILPPGTWGIPWSLVPNMVDLFNTTTSIEDHAGTMPATLLPQTIWPARPILADIPSINITGYTDHMNAQNRELRRLFGGVSPTEVVLDEFICCLRKNSTTNATETSRELASTSTAELVHQISQTGSKLDPPPSEYGYAYTGRAFITQDTFWFYSCVLMTCINSVTIKLQDIDRVVVVQDPGMTKLASETSLSMKSDMVILISLNNGDSGRKREDIVISTFMDNADTIAEKLRFAVNNAKENNGEQNKQQIGDLFEKINMISSSTVSHKSVVLDVPITFNHALHNQEKKNGFLTNDSTTVPQQDIQEQQQKPMTRPHAATVGENAKVNVGTLLKNNSNRQKEGSKSVTINEIATTPITTVQKPLNTPVFVDPDMLPPDVKTPQGPVECNCDDHLDRQDARIVLPISAKRLYESMFSDEQTATPTTDGGVWEGKTAAIAGHDLRVSKWETTDGKIQRILKYWMPVSNPIVRMKEAEVVETQILIHKEDHLRYTVQISTKTAALPYADAFIPSVRYCITWMSKSECQLTCYLGVRWTKSVFVRAIVTRAALKGMAESISVFIPILKLSSDQIRDLLLEESRRKKELQAIEKAPSYISLLSVTTSDRTDDDDEDDDKDNGDGEKQQPHITDRQQQSEIIVPSGTERPSSPISQQSNLSLLPKPAISLPCSRRSTVTAIEKSVSDSPIRLIDQQTKPTNITNVLPQNTKIVPQAVTNDSRNDTTGTSNTPTATTRHRSSITSSINIAKPSKKPTDSTTANKKNMATATWLSNFQDYMTLASLISFISVISFLFMGYLVYSYYQPSHSSTASMKNDAASHLCLNAAPLLHPNDHSSVKRTVYLRDLDEGFLKKSAQPPYSESKSFKSFLESKSPDRPDTLLHQQWHRVDHYRLSMDLDLSREHIALLRYDMLAIFQMLNRLDSRLVENEYMNWLLDTRLKCKHYQQELSTEGWLANNSMELCEDVKTQLTNMF